MLLAMFKYSCYIENSKEAREWLESIGWVWDDIFGVEFRHKLPFLLVDCNDGTMSAITYDMYKGMLEYNKIDNITDCTNNFPLFKALTAVRDDSDYMQQFVSDLCFYDEPLEDRMILCEKDDHHYLSVYNSFHKATKEELIERFKPEECYE